MKYKTKISKEMAILLTAIDNCASEKSILDPVQLMGEIFITYHNAELGDKLTDTHELVCDAYNTDNGDEDTKNLKWAVVSEGDDDDKEYFMVSSFDYDDIYSKYIVGDTPDIKEDIANIPVNDSIQENDILPLTYPISSIDLNKTVFEFNDKNKDDEYYNRMDTYRIPRKICIIYKIKPCAECGEVSHMRYHDNVSFSQLTSWVSDLSKSPDIDAILEIIDKQHIINKFWFETPSKIILDVGRYHAIKELTAEVFLNANVLNQCESPIYPAYSCDLHLSDTFNEWTSPFVDLKLVYEISVNGNSDTPMENMIDKFIFNIHKMYRSDVNHMKILKKFTNVTNEYVRKMLEIIDRKYRIVSVDTSDLENFNINVNISEPAAVLTIHPTYGILERLGSDKRNDALFVHYTCRKE